MIRPALDCATKSEAFFFIADYHALTTVREPRRLPGLTLDVAATWLALGLNPDTTVLYRQSDLPEVCELAWILGCVTPKGLLNRAHAYKAATDDNRAAGRDADAGVHMGLFNYPLLMAADILIHRTDVVPVGLDQKQHVEITRDIAQAFNAGFGEVFVLPEPCIDDHVMTIAGTDGRKMSKSYDNVIPILAPGSEVTRRVMTILTDSRQPDDPKDPVDSVLFTLYRQVADPPLANALGRRFRVGGVSYAEVKRDLAGLLVEMFEEPRGHYSELLEHPERVEEVLMKGATRARASARPVLEDARRAVGLRS
jgi:tryptophanyl-tRNA synthetase